MSSSLTLPLASACCIVGALTGCSEPLAAELEVGATHGNASKIEIIWRPKDVAPPQALSFESLRLKIDAGDVQLANGQPIKDPKLWEAVVVSKAGGRNCTAVVIGPNVLLTAAHCVDARSEDQPKKTIGGTVRVDSVPLKIMECRMPEAYYEVPLLDTAIPRSSHDYALCEFSGKLGQNVILESLSDVAAKAKKHQAVLMSGYGCINIRVFAGEIEFDDGQKRLRVGQAGIEALNMLDSSTDGGEYLRTRTINTEPILCPGDSGGPAFAGVTEGNQYGPQRRVLAVNSKVVALASGGDYEFFSFMTPVNSAAFEEFRAKWRLDESGNHIPTRDICGREIKPGSRNCRS